MLRKIFITSNKPDHLYQGVLITDRQGTEHVEQVGGIVVTS